MSQKKVVTFRISYEMFLFYNNLKNKINTKREIEGKKIFNNSQFYNYILNVITDSILNEEGRLDYKLASSRLYKINELKINSNCSKVINIRLNSYNEYKFDKVIGEILSSKKGEIIRKILYLYYIKNRAK